MTIKLSMKSNNCADLSKQNLGEEVTLAGWVDTVRDLGGITFVELRDRSGSFQFVADPKVNEDIQYNKLILVNHLLDLLKIG